MRKIADYKYGRTIQVRSNIPDILCVFYSIYSYVWFFVGDVFVFGSCYVGGWVIGFCVLFFVGLVFVCGVVEPWGLLLWGLFLSFLMWCCLLFMGGCTYYYIGRCHDDFVPMVFVSFLSCFPCCVKIRDMFLPLWDSMIFSLWCLSFFMSCFFGCRGDTYI